MTLLKSMFATFVFLVSAQAAFAGDPPPTIPVVDQFNCQINVNAYDGNPAYSAQMKLSGVRRQWTYQGTVFQDPLSDVAAKTTTTGGIEVTLLYSYQFANQQGTDNGWGLWQCLEGKTKYKGVVYDWPCTHMWRAVKAKDGVPQFGPQKNYSGNIILGNDTVGTIQCNLTSTMSWSN